MRVLLTRPMAESKTLAELLHARNIDSLIQPLLEIVPRTDATLDLADVQAVLLTSANGARIFAAASKDRSLPVFAVGDATARAVRVAGFAQVDSAGGDVEDLAALVMARLDPAAGRLCHVAGSAVAGDLAGRLTAAGFRVDRAVLYDARTCTALSPETMAAVREGQLDAVLFFSPRTAQTFGNLVKAAALSDACRGIDALCLSPAVAAAVQHMGWRDLRIAETPTQDALLALLPENSRTDADES